MVLVERVHNKLMGNRLVAGLARESQPFRVKWMEYIPIEVSNCCHLAHLVVDLC